jgi:hypothetical protein
LGHLPLEEKVGERQAWGAPPGRTSDGSGEGGVPAWPGGTAGGGPGLPSVPPPGWGPGWPTWRRGRDTGPRRATKFDSGATRADPQRPRRPQRARGSGSPWVSPHRAAARPSPSWRPPTHPARRDRRPGLGTRRAWHCLPPAFCQGQRSPAGPALSWPPSS